VVARAIEEAHRSTTYTSASTSGAANEATSYVGLAKPAGKALELLPPGYRVPRMQGGGQRDPAWVIFFVYNVITVEV